MAVTSINGFEGGAASIDANLFGTTAYDTGTVRTGARSMRCNPASGASGYFALSVGTGWLHFALRIASLPSVTRNISNSSGSQSELRLTSAGELAVYSGGALIGTSAALSTGTWYWIGHRRDAGSSVVCLQIDGANSVTGTLTAGTNALQVGFSGTEASAVDAYFDDIITDGATFLAPSKVDIALPISDNTRTAVTTGNGGTTNLWDAVNNTPPAGVASASETATSNIEYPASLTENYIANLETYTTLGIATGDTVLAVQSIVRHGEDITTGTKTAQNCGELTNPVVAGANITFGDDGGAHGAETGFWVTQYGTLTTSPSVTLGTSPTIRTSRVSQTRVGCIDFMAMQVAWTPAAAARVPRSTPYHQLLAH